ncbi:MFS transporter [Bordetella sp. N]|nr:MFS transporter [Bordetella sp. N]
MRTLQIACACTLAMASMSAKAEEFPAKPIKMLVGFSAGGSTDAIARLYASKLGEVLKTTVIVENRAGGSQLIAIRGLMSAPADGYTLFLASASAMSQGPGVRTDLPYDPQKDFTPIALVGTTQGAIVASPTLPVNSIGELVQYAKKHPDSLNYGSSGIGSASHLQTEYMLNVAGIKMTHIPYKADSEIMTAMAEGSVQIGISPLQGALPVIQSGRVRILAVTGSHRLESLPKVQALSEVADVPGLAAMDPYTYYALMGPKGMPAALVQKINAAVNEVSKMPQTVKNMHAQLYEPATGSPDDLRSFIAHDLDKWRTFSHKVKLD